MGLLRIILVSTNLHKRQEIQDMLPPDSGITIEIPAQIPDIDETGVTFEENAQIKALALADRYEKGVYMMAEDSGIEVMALDGRPGIYSARYGGEGCSDKDQCLKLLGELVGVSDRRARYYSAIALYQVGGDLKLFSGTVEGQISQTYEGENGFGYDPIFIPTGYQDTFGVLEPAIKLGLSHRRHALQKVIEWFLG